MRRNSQWGSKPFASDHVESAFALLSRQVASFFFAGSQKKSPPTDRFMNMNKLAFSPQSLYLDVAFYGHVWAKCRTAIMDCFVRETPSQVPSHTQQHLGLYTD